MIESHPNALEGSVKQLTNYNSADFTPASIILCRNTSPLVAFAYALLKRDVPCRIAGRDIGATLISVVKKMRATNLEDLQVRLAAWHERETARLLFEGSDYAAERIADQYQCLVFFIASLDESSRTVADLVAKIELIFSDVKDDHKVLLSTIHRAKGQEFPTVFLLDFHQYLPSRFAKLPWQKEQERNLMYVAVTRSMKTLFYINSNNWKEQE